MTFDYKSFAINNFIKVKQFSIKVYPEGNRFIGFQFQTQKKREVTNFFVASSVNQVIVVKISAIGCRVASILMTTDCAVFFSSEVAVA